MANTNTTTNLVHTLFAQGLVALREMAVMPRYVNRSFDTVPGEKGSTIQVSVPSAITAGAVTPSYVAPDTTGIAPTKKTITLDQWYEAAFFLNDKELGEIEAGYQNKQATEAIRALANNVDDALMALYPTVYGYSGTAGTTPFGTDLTEALGAIAALDGQLAPGTGRTVVLDAAAKAGAMSLRSIQDASWRADGGASLRAGEIGNVLGANWVLDQNVTSHTAGTGASATTSAAATQAVGDTTITLASAGTGTILAGDIITFAGDTQTYCVITGDADVSGGGTIVISPGLKVAQLTAAVAITLKASHVVNLMFDRDAFALASRPTEANDAAGISNRMSMVDPISGLSLTLEISREHYRTRYAFSTLYGVQIMRPELAARIAG